MLHTQRGGAARCEGGNGARLHGPGASLRSSLACRGRPSPLGAPVAASLGSRGRSPSPSSREEGRKNLAHSRQQHGSGEHQQHGTDPSEPAPMFGLPRVFSALIAGTAGGSFSSTVASATKRGSSPGPTHSSAPASPSPVSTASPSSASSSAASAAVGSKHPMLGSRLLNVGPNASPSVLAAALVASRDSTATQPSWVTQAAAAAAAQSTSSTSSNSGAASSVSSPGAAAWAVKVNNAGGGTSTRSVMPPASAFGLGKSGSPGAGGGKGSDGAAVTAPQGSRSVDDGSNGNGNGAAAPAAGGMISTAELNSMLAGLRASLESIQASRAQYVQLLAERDAQVAELQVQLSVKDQQIGDLEADLELANAAAAKAQADAEEAAALAAAAAAQVQAQAEQIAEATAAAQAAQEAALAAQQQQQLLQDHRMQQQQAQVQVQQQAQQRRSPSPPPMQRQAPAQEVVIYYRCNNWKTVFMHYNADGKGWTTAPGVAMENTNDNNVKVARIPCSRLEFVFNSGRGEWDSPPNNYHINSAGTWRVENGNVRQA